MSKPLGLLLWLLPSIAVAGMTCHIHPPGSSSDDEQAPRLVGPFETNQKCEEENNRLFRSQGRCHCSFDDGRSLFMPRPLQPAPGNAPALP